MTTPPRPRSRIGRGRRRGQPQHRLAVHLQHRQLVGHRHLEIAALVAEPGVVDQQIDRVRAVAEPRLDRGDARRPSARSAVSTSASMPCRSCSSVACSRSRSVSRATSTRLCPSAASRRAKAAPMPAVAPVISAVVMAQVSARCGRPPAARRALVRQDPDPAPCRPPPPRRLLHVLQRGAQRSRGCSASPAASSSRQQLPSRRRRPGTPAPPSPRGRPVHDLDRVPGADLARLDHPQIRPRSGPPA